MPATTRAITPATAVILATTPAQATGVRLDHGPIVPAMVVARQALVPIVLEVQAMVPMLWRRRETSSSTIRVTSVCYAMVILHTAVSARFSSFNNISKAKLDWPSHSIAVGRPISFQCCREINSYLLFHSEQRRRRDEVILHLITEHQVRITHRRISCLRPQHLLPLSPLLWAQLACRQI